MPEPIKEDPKSEGALSTFSKEDSVQIYENVKKGRIWRSLDFHLLPFVSLLYLLSFL